MIKIRELDSFKELLFGETGKKISQMSEQEREDLINKVLEMNKMEEIKVGEYVRTKRGIRKIVGMTDTELYQIDEKISINDNDVVYWALSIKENEVLKHSPNIIDLIEVGDYVNGDKIIDVGGAWKDNLETITIIEGETRGEIVEEDIKSVVTHEQFKNMEYKVGD